MRYYVAKTNKTKQKYAQFCLTHKLYSNPRWAMKESYHYIVNGNPSWAVERKIEIAICKDENKKPIAACVLEDDWIMFFVRKSLRRKGIGKRLAKEMIKHLKEISYNVDVIYGEEGIDNSALFFKSIGIEVK